MDITGCDRCRELLSARLDGETSPDEDREVDAHLAGCVGCRAHAEALAALARATRLRVATEVPDLTDAIVAAGRPGTRRRRDLARAGVAAVGITEIALSLPAVVLAEGAGAAVHETRHLGVWTLAYGVGLLVAAWKPARARGLLPFATALAVGLAVTGVLDATRGTTPAVGEAVHLLELVGVACLWLLAVPGRRPRATAPSAGHERTSSGRRLRVVGDDDGRRRRRAS